MPLMGAVLAGAALTGVADAHQGGEAVPEVNAAQVQDSVPPPTPGTPGRVVRAPDKNGAAVAATPAAVQRGSRTLKGKDWRIDVTHTGGKNYRVTITRKGKTRTYVKAYANLEAATSGALADPPLLCVPSAGLASDLCPLKPTTAYLITPIGALAATPFVGADGHPKWHGLGQFPYTATTECPPDPVAGPGTSTLEATGPGGLCINSQKGNQKRIYVRFTNGREFMFTYTNSAPMIWDIAAQNELSAWVPEYVRLNETPLPAVPMGAWWNTGTLPTAWESYGAVRFVYFARWVFVYKATDTTIGSPNLDLSGHPANMQPPGPADNTRARDVMEGNCLPPGVTGLIGTQTCPAPPAP